MKILLAHDGSAQSDKALAEAATLCEKFGASLTILNVVPDLCLSTVEVSQDECSLVSNSLLADARGSLKHATALAESKGVKADVLIRDGRPAELIVETAKEIKADYLVLGSTGKHGAKKFFMGSVSTKVAEHASCTVINVK